MRSPKPSHPITRRSWVFLLLAVLLYFAANQTQVPWLYVFTTAALGVWLAAGLMARGNLRGLRLTRRINGAEVLEYELTVGDTVTVELELHNRSGLPALQVAGAEWCEFAPPEERAQPFFLTVPARGKITLSYETVAARRGWFEFPPLTVRSRAPFGLFNTQRALVQPTGVLIFPEYREISRFPLLDRKPSVQNPFAQVGLGTEFVGVREYRPGDSPRHVHWRSTARVNELVVKEFSEETQPGLTIALDVRPASIIGAESDNTLERAIKVAATLAHYAAQRGLPVNMASNSRALPSPTGPVSRWAAMNYLARLEPDDGPSLTESLHNLRASVFVAVLYPSPDPATLAPLLEMKKQGVTALAVLIDPAIFQPELAGQAQALAAALRAQGIGVRIIGNEPDWEQTLIADDRSATRY